MCEFTVVCLIAVFGEFEPASCFLFSWQREACRRESRETEARRREEGGGQEGGAVKKVKKKDNTEVLGQVRQRG